MLTNTHADGCHRLHARFFQSYGPVLEGYELLGKAQTDALLTTLAQWQADPGIHHVVVLTGLPLLWPSEPLALVAAYFEGKRPTMHSPYQPPLPQHSIFTPLSPEPPFPP